MFPHLLDNNENCRHIVVHHTNIISATSAHIYEYKILTIIVR